MCAFRFANVAQCSPTCTCPSHLSFKNMYIYITVCVRLRAILAYNTGWIRLTLPNGSSYWMAGVRRLVAGFAVPNIHMYFECSFSCNHNTISGPKRVRTSYGVCMYEYVCVCVCVSVCECACVSV